MFSLCPSDALTLLTKYLRQLFNHAQPSFPGIGLFIQVEEGIIILSTSFPGDNMQYSMISLVFIHSEYTCWATIMFQAYF